MKKIILGIILTLLVSTASANEIHVVGISRMQVNSLISKDKSLVNVYGEILKDKEYVGVIIKEAIERKIPVNLALAIAWWESDFKKNAINKNVKNGEVVSVDRGIFQLNSKSFPKLDIDDFYNPYKNINTGLDYIKYLYNRFDSWESVILAYNWGEGNVASDAKPTYKAIFYFGKITEKERILDVEFTKKFYRKIYSNGKK